jgi:hypothetical protein
MAEGADGNLERLRRGRSGVRGHAADAQQSEGVAVGRGDPLFRRIVVRDSVAVVSRWARLRPWIADGASSSMHSRMVERTAPIAS